MAKELSYFRQVQLLCYWEYVKDSILLYLGLSSKV